MTNAALFQNRLKPQKKRGGGGPAPPPPGSLIDPPPPSVLILAEGLSTSRNRRFSNLVV